jgi:hypothetical protein
VHPAVLMELSELLDVGFELDELRLAFLTLEEKR